MKSSGPEVLYPVKRFLVAVSAVLLASALVQAHAHHKRHAAPSPVSAASASAQIDSFVARMVTEHSFERQDLYDFLTQVQPDKSVFTYFHPRPKTRYTPDELEELRKAAELRVRHAIDFYNAHKSALLRAEKQYGVPAVVIVGLIGIETNFGTYLGKFKEHEVLTTLAFFGTHRPSYFKMQLENFLLLARELSWDRANVPCSYAGAIGIPQFMPDNLKPYAVDWNNDGRIDLMDPEDAIGSVGNFLAQHGWDAGQPIATRAAKRVRHKTFVLRTLPGPAPTIWVKTKNFHVIREYNPLDSYVMAIFILATKVKDVVNHQVDVPALDELQIEVPPTDSDEPAQPADDSAQPEVRPVPAEGPPEATEAL
jgi:membrane-bound lytic murein transglycosylase B